jgi:Tol biopolymer transport system component/DNA-binding winged helix-turn-helix (wHTH) protein
MSPKNGEWSRNMAEKPTPTVPDTMERYSFAGFTVAVASRKLWRGQAEVTLPSRAFDTLVHLLRHRERLVDKEELIKVVWAGAFVSDDSLVHCVSVLRKALQDDVEHPKFIATLPRRGYQFVGAVEADPLSPETVAEAADETPGDQAPAAAAPARGGGVRLAWLGAGASALIAALVTLWVSTLRAPSPVDTTASPLMLAQLPPDGTTISSSGLLSPDGQLLAFVARTDAGMSQLWLRRLDSTEVRAVEGTEGASRPFWAPDSRRLGYFAGDKLRITGTTGGSSQTIGRVSVSPAGASWGADDVILFGDTGTGLVAVPADGGAPRPVTRLDPANDVAHSSPHFLADGRQFLYTINSWNPARTGIWIGRLDSAEPHERILDVNSPAAYASPGYLLYIRRETLVAARFDLETRTVDEQTIPLVDGVAAPRLTDGEAFSVSGALLTFRRTGGGERLVWFSRLGQRTGDIGDSVPLRNPTVSPDGTHLVASGVPSRDPGLWLIDLQGHSSTRLAAQGIGPVWSPDGRRIAFTARGGLDIVTASTVGPINERVLLTDNRRKVVQDWSPDGRYVVFTRWDEQSKLDLWLVPVDNPADARPLLATPANERGAAISPDGRWFAYTSDESGEREVYLQQFPGLGSKRVVSLSGGGSASWRGDGRELFYLSPDRTMMAVSLRLGSTPVIEARRALFNAPVLADVSEARNHYVVAPDGASFLVNVREADTGRDGLVVVVNWAATLREQVPVARHDDGRDAGFQFTRWAR